LAHIIKMSSQKASNVDFLETTSETTSESLAFGPKIDGKILTIDAREIINFFQQYDESMKPIPTLRNGLKFIDVHFEDAKNEIENVIETSSIDYVLNTRNKFDVAAVWELFDDVFDKAWSFRRCLVGENQNNPMPELTNENYKSLIFVCKQREANRVLLRPMMNVIDCIKFLGSDFAVEKRKSRAFLRCEDRVEKVMERNADKQDLTVNGCEEQANTQCKKRKFLNDDMFWTAICLENQVASLNKLHKKLAENQENKNVKMCLKNEALISTTVSVVNANFAILQQLQMSSQVGM
jgi:hypothetical protein